MKNRIVRGEIVERIAGGLYRMHFAGEPSDVTHEVPACPGQVWGPGTVLPVDVSDPQRMHILAAGPGQQRTMRDYPIAYWNTAAGNGQRNRWSSSQVPASLATADPDWTGTSYRYLSAGSNWLVANNVPGFSKVLTVTTGAEPWDASAFQPWWVDQTHVYGHNGTAAEKRVLTSGEVVWTSAALSYDAAAALFAVSLASSAIVVADQDCDQFKCLSTVDGSTLWSKTKADFYPIGALVPSADNTSVCYNPTADTIMLRYSLPGDFYELAWPRPEDGFGTVRYGRQLRFGVRSYKVADATLDADVTLGVYGNTGGTPADGISGTPAFPVFGGPDSGMSGHGGCQGMFGGATVDASGNLTFCVLAFEFDGFVTESTGQIRPTEKRTVTLCKVGSTVSTTPLGNTTDYGGNWNDHGYDLIDRLGPCMVAGYDVTNTKTLLWSAAVKSVTRVVEIPIGEDGIASTLQTLPATTLDISNGAGSVSINPGTGVWATLSQIAIGQSTTTGDGSRNAVILYTGYNGTSTTTTRRHLNVSDLALGTAYASSPVAGEALGWVHSSLNAVLHKGLLYVGAARY